MATAGGGAAVEGPGDAGTRAAELFRPSQYDPTRRDVPRERDDKWQDGRRCFRPETMAAIDTVIEHEEVGQALLLAS